MSARRAARGFSYIEILIATVLIAVALPPAMDALGSGLLGAAVHEQRSVAHYDLSGKMEDVLAQPFDDLASAALAAGGAGVASSYSDAAGTPSRRLVYLSLYDGDNADADNNPFTGTDPDLLWVRIAIEGSADALETLQNR